MASINTLFGYNMNQTDTFRLIRQAGFKAVILRWSDLFDNVVCNLQPDQARSAGLAVENVHARFQDDNDLWRNNLDGEAITRRLLEFIEDCRTYEIPTMVVHLNDGEAPPPCNKLGLLRVNRIAEQAERLNRNVAFENTRTVDCLASVFEQVHSRRIGFCYDSGHAHCRTPDVDLLDPYGSRLMALHLHDNYGKTTTEGRKDQHRLPFDGTIDWPEIMRKIAQYGYRGPVCLEVKNFFYDELSIEAFLQIAFERAQKLESMLKLELRNRNNN
ncbi:MAG: sugar phosphate isomerase/epimerase [Eubacteriales bacterium]|nr:sugar phosphate isomerase/epimerase [Eubacteriales bacterium]